MFRAVSVTVEKPILIQTQNLFNDFYEKSSRQLKQQHLKLAILTYDKSKDIPICYRVKTTAKYYKLAFWNNYVCMFKDSLQI